MDKRSKSEYMVTVTFPVYADTLAAAELAARERVQDLTVSLLASRRDSISAGQRVALASVELVAAVRATEDSNADRKREEHVAPPNSKAIAVARRGENMAKKLASLRAPGGWPVE